MTWISPRTLAALAFGTFLGGSLSAQTDWAALGYSLEVQTLVVHDTGDLAGKTTYRVYMNCADSLDYLSACSGDVSNPLILNTTDPLGWFNSELNASPFALGINPLFFGFFPDLQYDSFLTLGAEDSTPPPAQHPSSIWGAVELTAEFDGDGPGQSTTVNDSQGGAWYIPFPGLEEAADHPAFAGADLRVLVAQITTAGQLSGQMQVQIFREGLQVNEIRTIFPLVGEVAPSNDVWGCTNPEAPNFDPEATADDGSCNLACGEGTVYRAETAKCELAAWEGAVGDTGELNPCHLDMNASGWMDISDLYRILVVMGGTANVPLGPCGAGVSYDADAELCTPAPATLGEGNGLGNLNPDYFDLNGDGALDIADFLNVLNVFGKSCNG